MPAAATTTVDHDAFKSYPPPRPAWWSEAVQAVADGPTPTADACYIVAKAYDLGRQGVQQDPKQAGFYYQKAIALAPAHGPANYEYGRCLSFGRPGVPVDKVAALACYEAAAAAGVVEANYNAGGHYGRGDGCEQNDEKCVLLYKAAAAAGHPAANANLGISHLNGKHGLEQDDVAAVGYLKAAAEGKDSTAHTILGDFSMTGAHPAIPNRTLTLFSEGCTPQCRERAGPSLFYNRAPSSTPATSILRHHHPQILIYICIIKFFLSKHFKYIYNPPPTPARTHARARTLAQAEAGCRKMQ